ncbi:MAG: hypothetical protein CMH22_06010 [Methylophaga sp.]|mgnify:CR=1 FL=1|nr:hypothetical protein [Methylophaga sp.]|tara:strand:+ start:61569 stop:61850 length:282 start_codon:yes stop_codon:yes gene_type:complete
MKHELIFKDDNITLSKGKDGFWLYDESRGMNLAMKTKTEQEAFVEALDYYSKRLSEVEHEYKTLNKKVESFVMNFVEEEEDFNGNWHTSVNVK